MVGRMLLISLSRLHKEMIEEVPGHAVHLFRASAALRYISARSAYVREIPSWRWRHRYSLQAHQCESDE